MIDLHIHSNHSDGEKDLIGILKLAEEYHLDYIAITDHDNIDIYQELKQISVSQYYQGKVIPGVEIKVTYQKNPLEILAYCFDIEKLKKSKWVKKETHIRIQEHRLECYKNICKKIGIYYDKNLKLNQSGYSENTIYENINHYPENEKKLADLGIITKSQFFRAHICNKKSPFYYDGAKDFLEIREAVNLIHECGGIAVLAHPFGVYASIEKPKELIIELAREKIVDGFECMHQAITDEETSFLRDICEKYDMYQTGGSDYHGKRHMFSYVCNRKHQIPTEIISKLRKIYKI